MAPSVSTLPASSTCGFDTPPCGAGRAEPPAPVRAARTATASAPPSPPSPPPGAAGADPPSPPSSPLSSAHPLRAVASEASLDTLSLRMAGFRRSSGSGSSPGVAARRVGHDAAAERELGVIGRLYGASAAAAGRRAAAVGAAFGAPPPPSPPPASRLVLTLGLPLCVASALPPLPTFADFTAYYDARLRGVGVERRLFELLRGGAAKVPPATVAGTLRALLAARGSPLYERNLRLAVETVLYGIHADPDANGYSAAELAAVRLAASLTAAESSGVLGGALAALAPSRFAGMLMDWTDLVEDATAGVDCSCPAAAALATAAEEAARVAAAAAAGGGGGVKLAPSWSSCMSLADEPPCPSPTLDVPPPTAADGDGDSDGRESPPLGYSPPPMSTISTSSSADSHLSVLDPSQTAPHVLACAYHCGGRGAIGDAATVGADGDTWVCAGSLNAFCQSKGLLTPRAVATVVRVYGKRGRLSAAGFCRLFQALTTCGSAGSARYWFRIIDHDMDGVIGAGDVRHYYAHKRVLGHAAEPDVVLTCVRHVWTRLVAMSANADGLRLRDLRALTDKEREFVLCALLVRRVDDGGLVNVRATLRQSDQSDLPLGIVS